MGGILDIDQEKLNEIVAAPSESLNLEVKRWISPDSPEGVAKIVKGVFAIRNRNGGYFVIGFDDETLLPDTEHQVADVRAVFHQDKIQGIISNYASELFEIAVGFGVREEVEYPIIIIPEGVRAPVAAKRDLHISRTEVPIKEGSVYFRTLAANGTPSSAIARPGDWQEITEICFENKEADIGRFFRKHLGGDGLQKLVAALQIPVPAPSDPALSLSDLAKLVLLKGENRFDMAVAKRNLSAEEAKMATGLMWDVALVVDSQKAEAVPTDAFLNIVASANPRYSGWPIWMDSRNFNDAKAAPKVASNAWEALIVSVSSSMSSPHFDFIRLDPTGNFYHRRALQDDFTEKVEPGTALDPILVLSRVTEAIAVGLSLVSNLNWSKDTKLAFSFKWSGLRGRRLEAWAIPEVSISRGRIAEDSEVQTCIEVPLETPTSAIAPFVFQATETLFATFSGWQMPMEAIEYWVNKVLSRKF
jgi:hypothetical protein